MAQEKTEERAETDVTSSANGDAGRQIAYITGMSAEAAATFAAFHSGRFAQRATFKDA